MTDSVTQAKMKKIRALLAKAEHGATEQEAETYRAKAFQLMAEYGIEAAMLAEEKPEADHPEGRTFEVNNPWARENRMLLTGIAHGLGCRAVLLRDQKGQPKRARIFGYRSDLDRLDVLYTSLLLQMHSALAAETVPWNVRSARAWRRSWLLGFAAKVADRIADAEQRARQETTAITSTGRSAALVLADRSTRVNGLVYKEFPRLQKTRTTYSGTGYRNGAAAGARADIGGARIGSRARGAISR